VILTTGGFLLIIAKCQRRRVERYTPVENTYFSNVFFAFMMYVFGHDVEVLHVLAKY
jgi:hypothetical protein